MKYIKTALIIFTILFNTSSIFSQITFDKGYILDKENKKIECYIKNIDWLSNPSEIKYKITKESEVKTVKPIDIKEFSIENFSKYVVRKVNIDPINKRFEDLTTIKKPVFESKVLILKVLIEGKANLYMYSVRGVHIYLFNVNDSEIEQLIYKPYKVSSYAFNYNKKYKMQLYSNLNCNNQKMSDFDPIKYNKESLTKVFTDFNSCELGNSKNFEKKIKRDAFNVTIRPRINFIFYKFKDSGKNNFIEFGSNTNLGIGLELEHILPFHRNKWGVVLEPSYRKYNATETEETPSISGNLKIYTIEYSAIEIPIGIRHYSFINKNSKLFFNFSFVKSYPSNSAFTTTRANGSRLTPNFDIEKDTDYYAYGLGYKWKDRFSIELRNQTPVSIPNSSININGNLNSFAFILGYTIF